MREAGVCEGVREWGCGCVWGHTYLGRAGPAVSGQLAETVERHPLHVAIVNKDHLEPGTHFTYDPSPLPSLLLSPLSFYSLLPSSYPPSLPFPSLSSFTLPLSPTYPSLTSPTISPSPSPSPLPHLSKLVHYLLHLCSVVRAVPEVEREAVGTGEFGSIALEAGERQARDGALEGLQLPHRVLV